LLPLPLQQVFKGLDISKDKSELMAMINLQYQKAREEQYWARCGLLVSLNFQEVQYRMWELIKMEAYLTLR
jgi:hypothetical protein